MAMSVRDARLLAQSLINAADAAVAAGKQEIDLITSLQLADDKARSELQAAIEAATSKKGK